MSAPRISSDELTRIIAKKGYGIQSTIGKGIQSTLTRKVVLDQAGGKGEMSLLERGVGPKSVRPQDFAVPHPRCCHVRIQVFRRRLTDTGNDCFKYHIDACRYLGWLEDDNDATIRLTEEPHVKVGSSEEERVEITLEYEGFDLNDLVEFYKNGPKNQSLP